MKRSCYFGSQDTWMTLHRVVLAFYVYRHEQKKNGTKLRETDRLRKSHSKGLLQAVATKVGHMSFWIVRVLGITHMILFMCLQLHVGKKVVHLWMFFYNTAVPRATSYTNFCICLNFLCVCIPNNVPWTMCVKLQGDDAPKVTSVTPTER